MRTSICSLRNQRRAVAAHVVCQILAAACMSFRLQAGEIQLVSDKTILSLFGGGLRKIELKWHNPEAQPAEVSIRIHLLQASSATVAPLVTRAWKTLRILPGQTVMESAELDLPSVRAKTRFLTQWVGPKNQLLGTSTLDVYPDNLLNELAFLAGDTAIGVFDPVDLLQGTLSHFDTVNLVDRPAAGFEGKLAIITSESEQSAAAEESFAWVTNLAYRGIAIVWIQLTSGRREPLQPSFFISRKAPGTIVLAQSSLVSNLADNPLAQLNLVELAKMAVMPERAFINRNNL